MSILDKKDDLRPAHLNAVPQTVVKQHVERLEEERKEKEERTAIPDVDTAAQQAATNDELSLSDDRRVKTLSPTALVVKRFLRNRVAVTGLIILAFMFVFSFIGGLITPYGEAQLFYRYEMQRKEFASATKNEEMRFVSAGDDKFPSLGQAKFILARSQNTDTFEVKDAVFRIEESGEDMFSIYNEQDELVAIASMEILNAAKEGESLSFDLKAAFLTAVKNGDASFELDGKTYTVEDGAVMLDGEEIAYASEYIVQPRAGDVFLDKGFKEELAETLEAGGDTFSYTDPEGQAAEYTISFDAVSKTWSIMQEVSTKKFDSYGAPSKEHWLGTDRNGMDMLTRLMYGGRVSLYIGFVVVILESVIGIILGGISGYFGGWIDNLIMRIVDVFYCIPSLPLIIILGAAMDAMRVDPQIRMLYLMIILGLLGWAGIARMVRGQILSFREQEFMTATEACGIRPSRRIFRHLIPNVMPQLIVSMTMSLGSTIITEATLSFLGLGVKFPFASWGNIINDVNDTYVLTNYWFIWIPAGVCLVATVLAFNLVGDGLRDAFDPKMKR